MRLVNLMPLNEIDFPNQKSFDDYNRIHKLRPDTKVTVAGRVTTAGRAAMNSKPTGGTSVFNKGDDDIHPQLRALYKQKFGKEYGEEPTNNSGEEAPQKLVFPDAKKKPVEEPFEGGVNVLDTVEKLLPIGTGFTDKKTGSKIFIKGYKDNNMLVSHENHPNKILKWPLKQFFKLDTKRFKFHPKSK